MKNKALALFLALCMVVAMLPVTANAAPVSRTAQIEAQPRIQAETNALPGLPVQPNAGDYKISAEVVKGSSHGEVELSASSADAGEAVYLLANPDDGYLAEFGGSYEYLYYEMELGYLGLDIYEIIMPDGDVDLEISFVAASGSNHSVKLSKNMNGGTVTASRTKAKQDESVIIEVTVKDGYVLEELYAEDANGKGVPGGYLGQNDEGVEIFEVIMPATALYVEAVFAREEPHTIKVNAGEGGSASVDKTERYAGEEFILTCVPDTGMEVNYIDCRMYPDVVPLTKCGENQWKGVMPDGNVTIDVTFRYVERNVSVVVTNPEGGSASVDKTKAVPNTKVNLTCTPNENYRVFSVSGVEGLVDNGDNTYTFAMPTRDVKLSVTFRKIYNPVTVTVENNLGGIADADVAEAKAGDTVTLTCTPAEGYRVARITGVEDLTDNGDGTYTFTMPDKAVDIKVLFLRHENPFFDVNETQFFYESVLWAVEEGITSGLSATEFGPFAVCNRAQVVTFLWRYAGSPEPENTVNPFEDVPAGSFYDKAVLWAVEKGITNGVSDTSFGPNLPCNRAQVVTFLWRMMGQPEPTLTENPFTDVEPGWYEKPVLWALEKGITTGATADTFNPNGQCQRAQVVTFLYRTAQLPPPAVYALSTQFDAGQGTVTLSHTEAQAGETITVTVAPVEGWQIESVSCLGGTEVTKVSDTEYTFVMPGHEETVAVTFTAADEEPSVPVKTYTLDVRTNVDAEITYVDGKTAAAPGESIFFYVIPEAGYQLTGVGVFNPNNEIDLSKIQLYSHGDNLYEFVMIDHDIILNFYFNPA